MKRRRRALLRRRESSTPTLLLSFLSDTNGSAVPAAPAETRSMDWTIAPRFSRRIGEARGNKSRVAEILGVSRKTLYARLKRLNLQLP